MGGAGADGGGAGSAEEPAAAPEDKERAWMNDVAGARAAAAAAMATWRGADVATTSGRWEGARVEARRTRSRHRIQSREMSRTAGEATGGRMVDEE